MSETEHRTIIATHARREAQRLALVIRNRESSLAAVTMAGATLFDIGHDIATLCVAFPEDHELDSLGQFLAAMFADARDRAAEMARTERLTTGAALH